jgi:hypothetical protein
MANCSSRLRVHIRNQPVLHIWRTSDVTGITQTLRTLERGTTLDLQRVKRLSLEQLCARGAPTPEEIDLWLHADAPKALELQQPMKDDALKIVASGEREDRAREAV